MQQQLPQQQLQLQSQQQTFQQQLAVESRLYILDVEINKVTKSYPLQTDDSYGRTVQMYYILNNQHPKWADFDVVTADKSGAGLYSAGPFIMKAPTKSIVKDHAIASFLQERVKLKPEKPVVNKLCRGMFGDKHCNFVCWKLLKDPQSAIGNDPQVLQLMRRRFHDCSGPLYASDFMFVPPRKVFDVAVCEHVIYEPESVAVRERELKKHAEICLGNKHIVGLLRPTEIDPMYKKWSSIPNNYERKGIPHSAWSAEHPFFSKNCKYVNPGQVILTQEEQNNLSTENAALYNVMAGRGMQNEQDLNHWTNKLREQVTNAAQENYIALGHDRIWFALLNQWTIFEYLKFLASPPPPRAHPSAKLDFTQVHQDFGAELHSKISIWTNDKTLGAKADDETDSNEMTMNARMMMNASMSAAGGGRGGRGGGRGSRGGRGGGRGGGPGAAGGVGGSGGGGGTLTSRRSTSTSLRGKTALLGPSGFGANGFDNSGGGNEKKRNSLGQSLVSNNKYVILAISMNEPAVDKFVSETFPGIETIVLDGPNFTKQKLGIRMGVDTIHQFLIKICETCHVPPEVLLTDIEPQFNETQVNLLLPPSVRHANMLQQQQLLQQQANSHNIVLGGPGISPPGMFQQQHIAAPSSSSSIQAPSSLSSPFNVVQNNNGNGFGTGFNIASGGIGNGAPGGGQVGFGISNETGFNQSNNNNGFGTGPQQQQQEITFGVQIPSTQQQQQLAFQQHQHQQQQGFQQQQQSSGQLNLVKGNHPSTIALMNGNSQR